MYILMSYESPYVAEANMTIKPNPRKIVLLLINVRLINRRLKEK